MGFNFPRTFTSNELCVWILFGVFRDTTTANIFEIHYPSEFACINTVCVVDVAF